MRALFVALATIVVAAAVAWFIVIPMISPNYSQSPYLGTWTQTGVKNGNVTASTDQFRSYSTINIFTLKSNGEARLEKSSKHYMETGEEVLPANDEHGPVQTYIEYICSWEPTDGGFCVKYYDKETYTFTVDGDKATTSHAFNGNQDAQLMLFQHNK